MPRYRVKLVWNVPIEAASSDEALAGVTKLLKERPDTFIAGVEDFNAPARKPFYRRPPADK